MKYKIGDKVIFKYMDTKRLGYINDIYKSKNLKRQ